eukprot:UN02325
MRLYIFDKKKLTDDHKKWITDLEKRLEPFMKKMNAEKEGVFVKTSSRSPKDSPAAMSKMRELYDEYLKKKGTRDGKVSISCINVCWSYVSQNIYSKTGGQSFNKFKKNIR